MLGAILGDIVGSFYEFAHSKKRDLDPLFHPKADFTDDTAMKIAVAEPCSMVPIPRLPCEPAHRYLCRGYGGMFRRWIAS